MKIFKEAKKVGRFSVFYDDELLSYNDNLDFELDDNFNSKDYAEKRSIIYYITLDGEIVKIGAGQGGLKATISFYLNGLSPCNNDRTYCVWRSIREAYQKDQEVALYVEFLPRQNFDLEFFGEKFSLFTSLNHLDVERKITDLFYSQNGEYPIWNKQERGEEWSLEWKMDYLAVKSRHQKIKKRNIGFVLEEEVLI